ncbi:MAG TPA: AI-2E family transporter [Gemmatimonadaceae bacterium]|jgi:predicted PurR-regulated permease PerM|nr:AI-2E family transporter [Gemmatimonadaceae bacterium]
MSETSQKTAVEAGAHARRRTRTRARRAGWRNADVLRTASLVIAMYLVVRLLWVANALFLTAFLGILIGLAVSSGVDQLTRWRLPRGLSAGLIVVTFFALLVGFGAWMAPTLHNQGIELRRRLPDAIDRLELWVNSRRNGLIGLLFSSLASENQSDSTHAAVATPTTPPAAAIAQQVDSIRVASTLRARLGGQMSRVSHYLFPFLSSTLEVVSGLFIIIFLSVYIAADPGMYRRGIIHLFPHGRRDRVAAVLTAVASVLRRWLITQLIAMVTIGVVSTVVLAILGVKAAFALGLLSGMLEFIPTVGPIVSSLPAIAMGFLDSPEKALSVAAAYIGIQFLENHLLIPLLMKGGIDIPPALTILSQALMAILFGFLGLMCAVPLLAAVITAVKMLYVEDVVGDRQIGPDEDPQQGVKT